MTEAKKDYRDSVFLPQTEFPMQGGLPKKEPEILAHWQQMDLHGKIRAQAKGRKKFILHDGPPYANGTIHIGHALNKILKDSINRSYQMLGFDAPYVPGWDCHGLPIEWKIEEQYRAKGQDKDQVPVLQFRAECRAFAEHWKNVQSAEFQRLGVLGDWAHPYSTMTHKAEAQILREMYKFVQNGLLYKGVKPVMWSVVEKTALAEAEIEYHDHTSTTLWVKFPIVKTPRKELEGASIVIWTTTPWTIPANRAIAYGEDVEYVLNEFECCPSLEGISDSDIKDLASSCGMSFEEYKGQINKDREEREKKRLFQGKIKLLVAKDLLSAFRNELQKSDVWMVGSQPLLVIKGKALSGTVCSHPFRGREGSEGYFDYDVPLYFGEFVTTEAGTGFVHIAPGHGEDDFNLGQKYKIKFDETVGDDGRYLPNVKGFAGLSVYKQDGKVGEANGAIIKALLEANAMLAKKNIKHSYPHSWRSKAPLIFRTTPQWFIAMDKPIDGRKETLRELAMQSIRDTDWYPSIGENRIRGMIENRPDWCISRQRAWGVPIALFVDKKTNEVLKDQEVLDRVTAAFEKDGADAWYARKAQEFLGSKYKAEDFTQVFDVVDVWFESGATHAFVLEGGEWPNLQAPADLYLEGSDQHRGWFHSSMLESCGTRGGAPFKKVLTHGYTLDEQGRKMSKSLGNGVEPQEVMNKLGADILRIWTVSSDYMQDQRIGSDILKQSADLYRRFRNTLRYLLGALNGMGDGERIAHAEMPQLEQWVLHRLHETDASFRADMAAFEMGRALQTLHTFCNSDLSAFYFDIRKDSLYCDRPDELRRRATRTAMEHVFDYLTRWLAPIVCFTAEEAWLARFGDKADSVHLQTFLTPPPAWRNDALAEKWAKIRAVRRTVTGALERARNDKKIGAPLQAHPHVYVPDDLIATFDDVDFAEICVNSSLTLTAGTPPEDAFILPEMAGVGAVITLAEGQKCERCWQVLPEVGSHADHPDLCNRCHDAVSYKQKSAA